MLSPTWLFLCHLILAGSALAAVFPTTSFKNAITAPKDVVPNKFIIEVEVASDIYTKRGISPRYAHESLYEYLRKRDVGFRIDKEYNQPGIFVAAAITLDNENDKAKVAEINGVKAVRPIVRFSPPKPVSLHVITGKDDPAVPPDLQSTHVLTGVDKLHAEAITGKGIKIGIIDTGIDYTHPALGGGIGAQYKIIGGYDFVGDAYNGTNTPDPDDDPLDQCNGHGTHVAGIIGADLNNPFNISGVAYDASLTSYRIFGCTGGVSDDIIVDALLRGYNDGQDILTLSLGGSNGWTEGSTSMVVANRIVAAGRIVTIAAGNDGSKGVFFTSSPGNALSVISVASLDNTITYLQNATVHGAEHNPITYHRTFPLPVNGTLPVYATSTNTNIVDDACNPLPDDTPDLSGYVAVIRRGTCTFVQKMTNLGAKNGTVALIYDNGSGFVDIDVGSFNATLIQAADGEWLVKEFAAGANISISFPQAGGSAQFPNPTGGLISSFSSYGPTNDVFFKPAVAAPGGAIMSTLPKNTYGIASGTSMATPFMAGVSALLLSSKDKTANVAAGARYLFETTAQKIVSNNTGADPWQTAAQQGAGLVDAYKALHTDIIVSPGELLTNDTTHFKNLHTISITNTGKTTKKFKVSHVPAGTTLSLQNGTRFPADWPVPLSNISADVTFSETSFTVHPGQTQKITAHIKPPTGLDPAILPVFSGFVEFTNTAVNVTESYHSTYLGVAAALKDATILDTTDHFFGESLPSIVGIEGEFYKNATNFTFVDTDFPCLLFRLDFGTPALYGDLVAANETSPTTADSLGSMFEYQYLPRNSDVNDGTGFSLLEFPEPTFADGTTIPNGQYKLLLRALKVTGDSSKVEDYETWLSPIIGVQVQTRTEKI